MRQVTKEEFDAFISAYPHELVADVAAMGEPPILTFNDFALAQKWPESVVAKSVLWSKSYPNRDGSIERDTYFVIDS